jgi:selenide, water dikinase
MTTAVAPARRLLLIGGGHSQVEVIRQFGLAPLADRDITLVSPDPLTPYSGMLPGWIAGYYDVADSHINLTDLTRFARIRFVQSTVTRLDLAARTARLADGSELKFDIVSIDIGSTPPIAQIEGAGAHATPVKPVGEFVSWVENLHKQVANGEVSRVAVVGGGAAGVEVMLALRHRLIRRRVSQFTKFCLVTDTPTILPNHNARARRLFERLFEQREIEIVAGSPVKSVSARGVTLVDGREVAAQAVVWATGATAATWPAESGLAVDARGFVAIDPTLRSTSHPFVFATGDVASIADRPYPKSGVYAVRQGPILAANLRATLAGGDLVRFEPQAKSLALISAGKRYAIAVRGGWAFGAAWVWRWKDSIDRKFMRKYAYSKR